MKTVKKGCFIILISCFFMYANASAQEILTLDNYLKQVEENNSEVKAIDLAIESLGKKILELDMVYSPYLSADYNYTNDKSGSSFGSSLNANEITAHSLNLSAGKKFVSGASLTCGYMSSKASLDLAEPLKLGNNNLYSFTAYDMKPFVRIEQSLLRDYKGGVTLYGIKKAKASVLSGQYMQIFKKQQIYFKAKSAYWSLALAREILIFRNASLRRTEELLKWNENRVKLDLADKADLLQAQVGCKLRKLNCQMSEEDIVKASRDFNELLGIKSDIVNEELEKISAKTEAYSNIAALKKSGERADLLSAKVLYESSLYAEKETYYRSLPEISVYGMYSLHGLDFDYYNSWKQTTGFEKPAYTIGFSFIVPLDYKTLFKVRDGYKKDFLSAKESLKKIELSASNDWENILKSWINTKTRIALAKEIKDIQEQRVVNEQKRLEKGRTTTFLLLNAENDLDDAILNLYRLNFEELITNAQAEMYNTQEI